MVPIIWCFIVLGNCDVYVQRDERINLVRDHFYVAPNSFTLNSALCGKIKNNNKLEISAD